MIDKKSIIENSRRNPKWVHFGGGNLFRGFHAEIAQNLIENKFSNTGIIVCETFDEEIIEKAYHNLNNEFMQVVMKSNGEVEKKLINSVSDSYYANPSEKNEFRKVKEIFENPSLQMVTISITEKGYALTDADGKILPIVQRDMDAGPDNVHHTMSILASLLYDRFKAGGYPIALVSTDNFSHNGEKLGTSILHIVSEWNKRNLVSIKFVDFIKDRTKVSFPWTMIDRITPNPSTKVQKILEDSGIKNTKIIHTKKGTNIASFVNTEETHYLVIEDDFPNGRPVLEKAGVIMTDRQTVDKADAMKVTTCLNPLHTALAIFGCLLNYDSISEEMKDDDLRGLVENIGFKEGLPVVTSPEIIDPENFLSEVINKRLPNPYIPDTPQRIVTDTSQKISIRFGETIKKYSEIGKLDELNFIPLVIAAWFRYLMAIDDQGKEMKLSSDPLLKDLSKELKKIEFGIIDDNKIQVVLNSILRNNSIFGSDLVELGLAKKIIAYFEKMNSNKGEIRKTLNMVLNEKGNR
ncbi:mannitol dehydrogenase family protein [Companilactobacillus sp. HBUAS56257]|jgi:fructuronate reductase|uniref:mannitol dehydrogenase family protein n=1 Tax=Companilactobacillus sp. HBUAS56257 TaxID=3109360 RepID=UPI002FEE68A5